MDLRKASVEQLKSYLTSVGFKVRPDATKQALVQMVISFRKFLDQLVEDREI